MSKFDFDKLRQRVRQTGDALKKTFKRTDSQLAYDNNKIGQPRPEHAKAMKGKNIGENNPQYGKDAWNKGLDKSDPRVLKNVKSTKNKSHPGNQFGKGNIGKIQDSEWKRKRLDKIKGPHNVSTCPYCGKEGGERIMKRWHFDNCKHK